MIWLYPAAAVMLLTALLHSLLGERRLIGPLLAIDHHLTRVPLARRLIRLCWHLISIQMVLSAIVLLWPGTPQGLIGVVGAVWLFVGLCDAVITRGQHVGWPFLTGAGVLTLIGLQG